jgi:hypothetical protein
LSGVKTTLRPTEEKEKKKVRFHITIEEVEDEGEEQPTNCTLASRILSPAQQAKRSRDRREWRQRKVTFRQRERALAEGPRWTQAPPTARARLIPNVPHHQPVEVEKRAGIRLPTPPPRPIMRRRLPVPRTEKIDASNIRLLNAANFGFFCRQ